MNAIKNYDEILNDNFETALENLGLGKKKESIENEEIINPIAQSLYDIKIISSKQEFQNALTVMQKEYSIINRNGKVFILSSDVRNGLMFTDTQSFKTYFQYLTFTDYNIATKKEQKKYLTNEFLNSSSSARLDGIIFDPRLKSGVVGKYYNVWKGWKYLPIEGDISLFFKLVDVNFNSNQKLSEYFLNYLAHAIQKPENMPMTSIVIKGPQGAGKGTLIVNTVLGLNNNSKHIEDINMLIGDFNGHLADAFFICADELSFGGNKQEANRLKTFITEKQRTINDKMKTAFKVDAYTRSFILSNEDYVVNVEQGDRRYIISECSSELKGNYDWFDKYQNWLKDGGFNNIMYFLVNRDIKNFNPLEIPVTEAKVDLQVKSSDLSTKFLIDLFSGTFQYKEEICDGNKINRSGLYNQFVEYVKTYHPKLYIPSTTEFGKVITKAFEFEKAKGNEKWRTNWKNTKGYYYFMPRDYVSMEKIAQNLFKTEPSNIFFNYEECKKQNK